MIRRCVSLLILITVAFVLQSCGGSSVNGSVDVADIQMAAALAASGSDSKRYSVELTGSQVLPAFDTRHTGQAEFAVDADSGQLFGTVTTSLKADISATTAVHVHEGSAGEVGGIIVSLVKTAGTVGNNVFNVPAGTVLTSAQLNMYNNGKLYVDIHAGQLQLRAQLSDEQPLVNPGTGLSDLQATLFTPVCSGCHTGSGNSLPAVMNLTNAEATHRSLVSVFSIGEPDLLRIEPGDAANSLLIRKVEGTHTVGARMPFRGARLNAETIDALKQWINAGARP